MYFIYVYINIKYDIFCWSRKREKSSHTQGFIFHNKKKSIEQLIIHLPSSHERVEKQAYASSDTWE